MDVSIVHRKRLWTEINFSLFSAEDVPAFHRARSYYLQRIICDRDFCLFTNLDFRIDDIYFPGEFQMIKFEGKKIFYQQAAKNYDIEELVDDANFYLGYFYLLIGKLSIDDIINFNIYLTSPDPRRYTDVEHVVMENSGEAFVWVNPQIDQSFLSMPYDAR